MTLEQAGILIAILVGIGSMVYAHVAARATAQAQHERDEVRAEEFGRLKLQVETMWAFQLRRGVAEGITMGFASRNSPTFIKPEAREWFAQLQDDLRALYQANPEVDDPVLALEIEKCYGERILKEICIPRGLAFGFCLVAAIAVAKDVPVVEI